MTMKEVYESVGADYAGALERLMKESLIERFALKFLQDGSYSQLLQAIEDKNIENSFRAAHTLKGVAANLGFTGLQSAASDLTEQLRGRTEEADPVLLAKVTENYEAVKNALVQYQNAQQ